MGKIKKQYLTIDPWRLIEDGYHPEQNQVSESLFSLANEYMGVRGFLDEGVSRKSLIGTYFNGLYVFGEGQSDSSYKGITKKVHYMINSVNWLKTCIVADGETLDLASVSFTDFRRELDFKSGLLTRSFLWNLNNGKRLAVKFNRLLRMSTVESAYQTITFESMSGDIALDVTLSLDFSIIHWGKFNYWNVTHHPEMGFVLQGSLPTKQKLFSGFTYQTNVPMEETVRFENKKLDVKLTCRVHPGKPVSFEKRVLNLTDKHQTYSDAELLAKGSAMLKSALPFDQALSDNRAFFGKAFDEVDIEIGGDPENQQGIRFCLFQLLQTYHGFDPSNNIGAKGLTGEAYSGHAFWDTETYCLPFYLFNQPEAAKYLLMFRYHTLPQAKERAKEIDCLGACYPIATLNGDESCNLWQHASLQPQPSTAVAYAVMHYVNNTKDLRFLADYGLEMLIEISRYLFSRGDFNLERTKFGFFGVMGPDEFQMMVNHNAYTNLMGKWTFESLFEAIKLIKAFDIIAYQAVIDKTNFASKESKLIREAMAKTYIPFDKTTNLFEQHQGYFELPHVDVDKIPETDFPLYHNWSYDRIYRNDMIKQPDVLMFLFLHNQRFTKTVKRINYEFYEPRCIHESSLSPSIHSVLAMELGKTEEAVHFFQFATRMDLDDYNRNALEGLHLTSIAAAWVNIVYGFGGVRTDGDIFVINPQIPAMWTNYSFHITYLGVRLSIQVQQDGYFITASADVPVSIQVGKSIVLLKQGKQRFDWAHH